MSDRLYSDPDFYVRVQKTKLAIVVVGLALAAVLHSGDLFAQQPAPVPKNGGCPTGFYQSGNYCVPSSNNTNRPAIPKNGACPTGWYSSGNYCVKSR